MLMCRCLLHPESLLLRKNLYPRSSLPAEASLLSFFSSSDDRWVQQERAEIIVVCTIRIFFCSAQTRTECTEFLIIETLGMSYIPLCYTPLPQVDTSSLAHASSSSSLFFSIIIQSCVKDLEQNSIEFSLTSPYTA